MGAEDGTKAHYALVYGDFRRVHRMGLIACSYRAAEWRHKEIELTAVELLQYRDTKSERVRELIIHANAGRPSASRRRRH